MAVKIIEQKRTEIPRSGQTVSGYGSRLATSRLVKLSDSPKWYRVYVICYSNSGSAYIRRNGKRVFINE